MQESWSVIKAQTCGVGLSSLHGSDKFSVGPCIWHLRLGPPRCRLLHHDKANQPHHPAEVNEDGECIPLLQKNSAGCPAEEVLSHL